MPRCPPDSFEAACAWPPGAAADAAIFICPDIEPTTNGWRPSREICTLWRVTGSVVSVVTRPVARSISAGMAYFAGAAGMRSIIICIMDCIMSMRCSIIR